MTQYEVTFIVDPVLSGEESKSAAKTYQDMLSQKGGTIVNVDNIGLRSLAYPINKRTTGVYYCVEFQSPGTIVDELELALRRDERIMRYLTVKLDKYGIQYNEDKRAGKIGQKRDRVKAEIDEELEDEQPIRATKPAPARTPAPPPPAVRTEPEVVPSAETIPPVRPIEAIEIDAPAEVITPTPAIIAGPSVLDDSRQDDLTKVEGIGPKINELLQAAGINTFDQLAKVEADKIRDLLSEAGSRFSMHDPSTWAQQAELAAAGNFDELSELQDRLKSGKEEA